MHQETSPPKISSRKISHMPESFHRTGGMHCFCAGSVFSSVTGVVFFRTAASISPVLALASCSPLLILVHRAARSPGQARASAVSWQEEHRPRERRQQHSLRLPERRSEGRRRPAPPTPPGASAWPSSSLDALQHRRRGLSGAEHAHCRRRAREAVPSRAGVSPKSDRD